MGWGQDKTPRREWRKTGIKCLRASAKDGTTRWYAGAIIGEGTHSVKTITSPMFGTMAEAEAWERGFMAGVEA